MKLFALVASLVCTVVMSVGVIRAQSPVTITVVRDPSCSCCIRWVEHLEKAGFTVTVTESSDMEGVKDRNAVPTAVRSCHTAVTDGYVIEGHVPAADIQRLLRDRPDVAGIAVPEMPTGSPGMESSTGKTRPFDVLAFDRNGRTEVFASYGR